MRHAKLDVDEILAAEKAKDDRQRSRAKGFSKMRERDASCAKLRNYNGSEVLMRWHVPEDQREEYVVYSGMPEGMFSLEVDGKTAVFDAEEFRKQLRWV